MTKATETINNNNVTKKIKLVAVKKTTLKGFGGSHNKQETVGKKFRAMQQDSDLLEG